MTYCLLDIALYSIYSTESTFPQKGALCGKKKPIHVMKLTREKSASETANEFPCGRTGFPFLLLMTHEIVYVTK